jgi:hypothetical protein
MAVSETDFVHVEWIRARPHHARYKASKWAADLPLERRDPGRLRALLEDLPAAKVAVRGVIPTMST